MIALLAESNNSPVWLLIIGPAGGGALYFGLWQYYRNTGKSHSFERETKVQIRPATGSDRKVGETKRTTDRRIEGHNSADHRQRVQRMP